MSSTRKYYGQVFGVFAKFKSKQGIQVILEFRDFCKKDLNFLILVKKIKKTQILVLWVPCQKYLKNRPPNKKSRLV